MTRCPQCCAPLAWGADEEDALGRDERLRAVHEMQLHEVLVSLHGFG
jgi:hypothetical protein